MPVFAITTETTALILASATPFFAHIAELGAVWAQPKPIPRISMLEANTSGPQVGGIVSRHP